MSRDAALGSLFLSKISVGQTCVYTIIGLITKLIRAKNRNRSHTFAVCPTML